MTSRILIAAGLLVVLAIALPAGADHNSAPSEHDATLSVPGTEHTLDLNLKLGLNGETRKDGFSLDGRVEHDGKAHNFKFNADIDEWLRRAIRWWGAMDL